MDGTAIMQGVATIFVANVYSIDLGLGGYLTVIGMAVLASIGTAGVPGVGLIMLAMVFTQVGLPVEGIALIMGVDRLLDMMRTAVNVTGDLTITSIVAKSEGSLDEDIGRVVAENLSLLLKTDKVINFPWRRNISLDYTIEVQVSRLEGSLGGDVDFVVRWAIFDAENNNVLSVQTSRITEPVHGNSYGDLVNAQSRALATYSRQLADAIRQLGKS